ncbi:MAG: GNAT family N-acetyltransferase [Clostridia bacterium]|nr:GNAT family N-acetyltransferase [Clostridia bacterium]
MLYSFIIRRAEEKDAPAVFKILQTAFKEYAAITGLKKLEALTETVDDIRSEILSKAVYIAVIDDTIVGTVRLDIHNKEAYLSRFAVDSNNRNIGIGKALISVVDKFLKEKGVQKVTLHTASKHGALMRFYYSRGFFVEGIETDRGYLRARLVKEYSEE